MLRSSAMLLAHLAVLTAGLEEAHAQTTWLVPLVDLAGGSYLGHAGGLYPGGFDEPPPAHAAAALRAARAVVPRSADGRPDPDGVVGVLGVGVSNLGQEWREFSRRVDRDPHVAGHLVLVDGAVNGGYSHILRDPLAPHWAVLDDQVSAAGLGPLQVQLAFVELTSTEAGLGPFPLHAERFRDDLREVVVLLRARFPNLRVAFLSTTTFTGHAASGTHGEPRTYEQAFGVRWLIEDQIAGDARLAHDPRQLPGLGAAPAPLLLWGPYLWADGPTPRAYDGFASPRSSFEGDGVHPSATGESDVAALFEAFVGASATAREVFRRRAGRARIALPVAADAELDLGRPGTALGLARSFGVFAPQRSALLRFDLPAGAQGRVVHAKLALQPLERCASVRVRAVTPGAWSEASVTAANAPTALAGAPASPSIGLTSEGTLAEWDVTSLVASHTASSMGGPLDLALEALPAPFSSTFRARQDGGAGWLALALDEAPGGVALHCPSLPLSAGGEPRLLPIGSASVAADDLVLSVADAPPGAVLLPLVGDDATEVALPGGDLCVGGVVRRLPAVLADAAGRALVAPDWRAAAGERRTAQLVLRDPGTGALHLSNAVTVVFRP